VDVEPIAVRVPEAAKMLGVSRSVLYELIRMNAIPSFTIGTARLLPVEGLRGWVAAQAGIANEENDESGR
jgi:excisionase family DNA binding protein